MKGYKGMSEDMTCRGFKYEIGKTYETNEPIGICRSGFHFCKNLVDVFGYYAREYGSRYFEVEAERVIEGDDKCVSSRITIIRELDPIEVNRACYGYGYGDGNGNGYGNGNGDGYGYGDGYGDGNGNGYGNGNGNGNGYGDGYGGGNGNGYGDGDGDGYGYGDGDGDGYGYGYGKNIQKILNFMEV